MLCKLEQGIFDGHQDVYMFLVFVDKILFNKVPLKTARASRHY